MTSLDRGFEDNLREAVLDKAEAQLYGERDNIAFDMLSTANDNFRDYAAENDYELESIIESGRVTATERTSQDVSATFEWGPLSGLFEFGVAPHTIDGNPLLHFYWEAKNQWIKTESVNWGSETGGIPESRAIRNALNETRRALQG